MASDTEEKGADSEHQVQSTVKAFNTKKQHEITSSKKHLSIQICEKKISAQRPNFLTSPKIDAEERILSDFVAWRSGTTTLFLFGFSPPIDCLKIPAHRMRKPCYLLSGMRVLGGMGGTTC